MGRMESTDPFGGSAKDVHGWCTRSGRTWWRQLASVRNAICFLSQKVGRDDSRRSRCARCTGSRTPSAWAKRASARSHMIGCWQTRRCATPTGRAYLVEYRCSGCPEPRHAYHVEVVITHGCHSPSSMASTIEVRRTFTRRRKPKKNTSTRAKMSYSRGCLHNTLCRIP